MHDLTLCAGGDCPLRDGCLRFRAERPARFDQLGSVPFRDGACDLFVALPVPDEGAIRARAWAIWEAEGRPEGRADAHWFAAEGALRDAITATLR